MVDRLEAAGFAARRADPTDRRRVIVVAVEERMASVEELFEGIANGWRRLLERYSAEQLGLLLEFLEGVHRMSVQQVAEVGQRPD